MANSSYKTPVDMFYQWEEQKANEVFFHQPYAGKYDTYTWAEVGRQVRAIATSLKNMGLPKGSRIGLVSKNCAHWIMADLAIMISGHVSVPIYPNVSARALNYVLTHSGAEVLFVGKLDDWGSMKDGLVEGVRCIKFPKYPSGPYEDWDDIVAANEGVKGKPGRDLDELMTIIYTSGTTGVPKGVMHNFRSFSFAATNGLKMIDPGADGRLFSYLPLSHIAERLVIEAACLYLGIPVYFAESLDTFPQNLQTASPTIFLGVPRIWAKFREKILDKLPQNRLNILFAIPFLAGFIKKKIRTQLGLNNVVHALTGAAPTPPSLIKWYEKLGIKIQEVYGMTENSAYSHYTRKDNIKIGYTGQPMPHVDVKISDVGEILVKSEANMVGYYKMPEKTAASFEDGYLKTGDKGQVDSEGFLKITGRVKDIFKTAKGKYIAPNPIELSIAKDQYVGQVCVVGRGLVQPIALIVLAEGVDRDAERDDISESLTETITDLNKKLAKHEKLKAAVVVKGDWTPENELVTPTLKIKRSAIDAKYEENYERWHDDPKVTVWE